MVWGIPKAIMFAIIFLALVLSVGFFVFKSYATFEEIAEGIAEKQRSQTAWFLDRQTDAIGGESLEVLARTALEIDTTVARHQRSASALITRTWLRFMSACFGAILISIGALFVLGQVTAGTTKADVDWNKAKVSLVVSSPGLLLAVLGTILIMTPNVAKQTITADDSASFFGKSDSGPQVSLEQRSRQALKEFCAENPEAKSCETLKKEN